MTPDLFGKLMRDVSRSFYLTLRVLPSPVRLQIGLAYLLARAADSIADTALLDAQERLQKLLQFRKLLVAPDKTAIKSLLQTGPTNSGSSSLEAERKLLEHLPECFQVLESFSEADRAQVVEVVSELTVGMELDLQRFSNADSLHALERFEELEQYTYHVAGCVGPFWTRMCISHLPSFRKWKSEEMCALGIRFGKALQWTNILRDIPRDLANGRCYLPLEDLKTVNLAPNELLKADSYIKLQPLYGRYLDHAMEHYRAAWQYAMAIPKLQVRLRLACIWPIWIGMATLALLRRGNPLDPNDRIRISRSHVYSIMLRSLGMIWSNKALNSHQEQLIQQATKG
jgi:farnesyl-diphosphate farnesyltransferase